MALRGDGMADQPVEPDRQATPSLRRVLRLVASLVSGRAAGNLLTLVYTLLLARIAAPADFGLVMTGFAWAMLASIVLALNVESGAIKYLVRYRQTDQLGPTAGFLRFNLAVNLLMTALLALVCAALWAFGLVEATDPAVQVYALALVAAPVVALTRVYGRHATALDQVLRGALPVMFLRPAVICLGLAAVWLAGASPGPVALMLLMLAAFAVTALVQAFLLRRTFRFARAARPDYGEARLWLATGAAMAPLLLMRDNLKHVVVAAAGLTLAPTEVGHLALAFSIMSLVLFSVKAVDMALSPQLSQALQAGQMLRTRQVLNTAARLKLLVLVLGSIGAALFGRYGLGLFGPAYAEALPPLLLLLLIPAADTMFGAAQIVLNVTGRQSAVFWSAGISAALLVMAVAAGGWLGGAEGAAIGAGISYLVQQMLLWALCRWTAGVETSLASLWAAEPGQSRR
jgi:O-antigen/teichoic acid export membrane protein